MRNIINQQTQFGEINIADIILDPASRDDIPNILSGLQYIYLTEELRERVFDILQEVLPVHDGKVVSADLGRPGMEQWKILVLGTLRLGLNADYDRIHELANQHITIREMLGHSGWLGDDTYYSLDAIKDNLRLFTPEILDRINQEVVRAGHQLVKKTSDEERHTRVDSFVLETDVHWPTDINVLLDAVRKAIETCAHLCAELGLTEWRQSAYLIRRLKKLYRKAQRIKHSTSKDEVKRQARQEEIAKVYTKYLDFAEEMVRRLKATRWDLALVHGLLPPELERLDNFIAHAERQIDQTDRRVLQGETIPHHEKVFSIFEPHTEWISKGKAGVPVELGLRVCVVEDQYGFILHHDVMEKITDDAVAVPIMQATIERFPDVSSASMDKGFHSPENQKALAELIDTVVLPKKGRLSLADQERENDSVFVELRRQHPAVESAINALEVHGLDRCLDHGIDGFKRYVALAVVARNIHKLGAIRRQQEQRKKRGPYKKAA